MLSSSEFYPAIKLQYIRVHNTMKQFGRIFKIKAAQTQSNLRRKLKESKNLKHVVCAKKGLIRVRFFLLKNSHVQLLYFLKCHKYIYASGAM